MVSKIRQALVVPTVGSLSDPVLDFRDIFAVIISVSLTRFASKQLSKSSGHEQPENASSS
jgi:hypothetical protein